MVYDGKNRLVKVTDSLNYDTLFTFDAAGNLTKQGSQGNSLCSQQNEMTDPNLPLEKYAGKYEEAGYGTTTIAFADDKLTAKWGKYTFRLDHYHFDTFTAVPVEPKDDIVSFDRSTFEVQFKLGTDGGVTGLRFLDQDFTAVKKK